MSIITIMFIIAIIIFTLIIILSLPLCDSLPAEALSYIFCGVLCPNLKLLSIFLKRYQILGAY